jgi:hypothetical protein
MNSTPAALSIKSYARGPLKSQRIDDFQERELIEIGIAGADLPDAALAHENCCMSIVEQITGEVRHLELIDDSGRSCSAGTDLRMHSSIPRPNHYLRPPSERI